MPPKNVKRPIAKKATTKIRPPVKWHGGKHYLAKWVISQFPSHTTYVEPFGGAASVLLNKEPSKVEVYNDLDKRIVRLFRVIRDHGDELRRRLSLTPYSEAEFLASAQPATEDDVESARRDYVRWRQSLGGRGDSFSFTLHRERRQMADVVSGYLSSIDEQLPLIVERMRTVQLLCRPAIDVIETWDSINTLFYCDPPYVHSTRHSSSRAIYGKEMSEKEHAELAATLNRCKGKIIVSGYPSQLYEKLFNKWRRIAIDIPNHASGSASKEIKSEVIWLNW